MSSGKKSKCSNIPRLVQYDTVSNGQNGGDDAMRNALIILTLLLSCFPMLYYSYSNKLFSTMPISGKRRWGQCLACVPHFMLHLFNTKDEQKPQMAKYGKITLIFPMFEILSHLSSWNPVLAWLFCEK